MLPGHAGPAVFVSSPAYFKVRINFRRACSPHGGGRAGAAIWPLFLLAFHHSERGTELFALDYWVTIPDGSLYAEYEMVNTVFQEWRQECEAVQKEMDRLITAGGPPTPREQHGPPAHLFPF